MDASKDPARERSIKALHLRNQALDGLHQALEALRELEEMMPRGTPERALVAEGVDGLGLIQYNLTRLRGTL